MTIPTPTACPAPQDATPAEMIEWLKGMLEKWRTKRAVAQQVLKGCRRDSQEWVQARASYEHCITQEQRYLGLLDTVTTAFDDVVDGVVRERMEIARAEGDGIVDHLTRTDQRYRYYNISRAARKEVTLDQVVSKIDTTNTFVIQGLEQATKVYCPYDPLDGAPCPQCGRDEPTLEV